MSRRNRSLWSARSKVGTLVVRVSWILGVLVWLKVTSMLTLAWLGAAAWAGAEYDDDVDWSRWSLIANVIEGHRAHFNLGTARAAAGDLPGARSELEEALRLTSAADECSVRLNLSLVLEASAATAEKSAAEDDLNRARAVLDAAPKSCRGSALDPVAERLGKTPASGDKPAPPEGTTVPAAAPAIDPNSSELEALQGVMEAAYNDMSESETTERNTPPGTSVDKPW